MKRNMDHEFRQTVSRQPDHLALLGPGDGQKTSYAELDAAIEAAAIALREAGVAPRHTVGLHAKSGAEYIVLSYAIWRVGGCTVPIATELSAEEKHEICRGVALDFVASQADISKFAGDLARGEALSITKETRLTRLQSGLEHPAGFHEINAAFIRFTSGTTGDSKGVVLSHESIDERIRAANEVLRIGPNDRVMWLLSMSYHFTVSIVGYLTFGATIILPRNGLAGAVVDACEKYEATFFYGSPMHCALMADYPAGKTLPSLRVAISTTTALDPDVAARFRQRYGVGLSQALGVIEIGLPCINLGFAGEKNGSVGEVLPAYRIRLDDVGFGPGLREVFFSGPGLLDAYYRPFRTRDHILQDGWFATHDVGDLDEDGCLTLRGRAKEVISVMGMKFFPQEVANVLKRHPSVKEAAAFGVRHERTGEAVRARVVPNEASHSEALEPELKQHCAKHLATYKVPERIEIVASLPRTASGKVLHRSTG